MCGFLGMFGPFATSGIANLDAGFEAIKHRGPDGRGRYVSPDGKLVLGHLRLAIVDLSAAASQPMLDSRGYAFSYNGEVYNHDSLRKQMPGEKFLSHSDTETLFKGMILKGPDFLSGAIGMYAGAFYTEGEKNLVLFRDPLGIKPLYFVRLADSSVVFASEIKALFALAPELSRRVDLDALGSYLTYENFVQGKSLFQGIQLLEPGGFLSLNIGSGDRVQMKPGTIPYKASPPDPYPADEKGLADRIREEIEISVDQHLMADVPLGVYLSGGIDSSTVATLASRRSPGMLGFTGFFDAKDAFYDERPVSREVAKAAKIDLIEVPILPTDLTQTLDAVVHALDEPRMGMGSFSQYMVARVAAQHRKVILAGHGGDELFAGYPAFKAFWMMQNGLGSGETWRSLWSMKSKELPWLVNAWVSLKRHGRLQFAPEIFPRAKFGARSDRGENSFFAKPTDSLEQLRNYYRTVYLPGLLMVEDKISMAHSLETRVPLWSQQLLHWGGDIPAARLLPDGQLKGLLKKAVAPLLPAAVLSAPKRGFPTPLRLWFRTDLVGFLGERLLEGDTAIHSLVPRSQLEKLIQSHRHTPLPFALDERRAHRLWMMLCLESWFRQYRAVL